jgi:hypothetical protein
MKAGHSKLDGYRRHPTSDETFPRLPTVAHPLHRRLLRFYALIPSPFYPPPNRRKYLLRRTQERRAPPLSHRLPLGKSRMVPYHARPCTLPRPEHLLNRLAAEPPPLSPASIAPLAQHPQRLPSLGYPSLYLLLVKLVKHFCWMLSSYLQWPCYIPTWLRIRLTGNGITLPSYIQKAVEAPL